MPEPANPPVVTPPVVTPPAPDPNLPATVPGEKLADTKPEDIQDTNSALDELLKQTVAENDEPVVEPPAAPAAPDKDKPATPPAPVVPDPAKPVIDPAKPNIPADDFDKVELPPYTKPKSVEAFATVKQMARERIATIEKEKADLTAKLAEKEKLAAKAGELPEETVKELEDLRQFRLKFDVEADPSFKTWDNAIKENEELIYSRLRAAGVEEASIKRIQEVGGPGAVDWEALAAKFSPTLKRYIEGKVFENEDLAEKKKQAIEKAKGNAAEFVRTRQEELYKGTEDRQKEVLTEFEAMRPNITWLKETPVPASATPEEKAKLEAENALVKRVEADMQEAFSDDSPKMKAILVAGFAQLMRLRVDTEAEKAQHVAEVTSLKAALKEKDDFIARIKKSSTARLSSAAPGIGDPKPVKKVDINEDPASALDRHYKEVLAAQEK